jgi:hypothetical protein
MPKHHSVSSVPAALLARKVLDLWITNDYKGLDRTLGMVIRQTRIGLHRANSVMERERQELMRGIARNMERELRCWNAASREPRYEVWMNLLRHLSDEGYSFQATAPVN